MKKRLVFSIPVLSVLVSSLLIFTTADNKIQDMFQRPLKSTVESPSVVMVNINDHAVDQIGTWPFSRDVYADSLVIMKELGAESAVFDLSFLDKSPVTLDYDFVTRKLPKYIDQDFEYLAEGYSDIEETLNSVKTNISHIINSYDEILGQELDFFDNSYICFTFNDVAPVSDEAKSIYENLVALKNVTVTKDTKTPEYKNALYALPELVQKSNGAGFVNADTDADGYIRRLHPVVKFDGKYYGQLVLVPLLHRFGDPAVEISSKYITLKNAKIDENTTKDIRIPRNKDGSVTLKFPKKLYKDYNSLGIYNIYRIADIEKSLYEVLQSMDDIGFFSYFEETSPKEIFDAVKYIHDEIVNNGMSAETGITFENYMEYKQALYDTLAVYFDGEQKELLLSEVEGDDEMTEMVTSFFARGEQYYTTLVQAREKVGNQIKGAMCIFGTTATSTSDFGVIQYQPAYPNPGAHYTLANMILAQDFVDDSNPLISILIAILVCLIYSFIANKIKGTSRQIILGLSMIAGSAIILFAIFAISRTFLGFTVPELSLALTFVITTTIGFLTASKDKKFITNAFSQCLSKEVVNEIVANPSSFKLGGQRLEMTAIFTDIQKFSSFSELLTASQLVALLNYYLTKMSDIIMDERGTVDKYEGDAIIALVGAPVKMDDHASRAVTAALKMKAAELKMNEEIKNIAAGPKPADMDDDLYDAFTIMIKNGKSIFTRIGLNSGEMIAGYMGSENKKNYTMMGNNVNLASRLEGVNKQYSTGGILCSEATRKLLGDEFIVRRLDRVRVVNVNTPIRLYEPMGLKSEKNENLQKYVKVWESVMDAFEAKEYDKAYEGFRKLSESNPGDNVAKYYMSLLEKFFKAGKYPVEADNFGVEYNPEDGVFKLLQK